MYIESDLVSSGLYRVIIYSIGHHVLLEKLIYAGSFEEAENQVRKELNKWKS